MAADTLTQDFPDGCSLLPADSNGAAMTAKQIPGLLSIKQSVSAESVARYFGGSSYIPNQKTNDRIYRAIDHASDLATPAGIYTICPVQDYTPGKEIILENSLKLSLPDCIVDPGIRLVAAAVGTLGDQLEKRCRYLGSRGDIYEATLLDAVGTSMLDLLGKKMSAAICRDYLCKGLHKGPRFAPGLEGYPMEQQELLFQIVDNKAVGIFLNSSNIMIPGKSISFFLMLTKTLPETERTHKCSSCRMKKCQFRRV